MRRKLWQAVYPILSRTPSSPSRSHLGPPVSTTQYYSQGAPLLHLTEVLQTGQIPQPEVVGAANLPASTPVLNAPPPPPSRYFICQSKWDCFLLLCFLTCPLDLPLCLENYSLLTPRQTPLLPPFFSV